MRRREPVRSIPLQLKTFALLIAVAGVFRPISAQADIYAWRDEHGRLVVSEHPAPQGVTAAQTFAVHGTNEDRTTAIDVAPAVMESQLLDVVAENAAKHEISADLVRAVIRVESNWNPRARSAKGAQGLMQLMPATAAQYGVSNAYDPEQNIKAGVAYLKSLIDCFDGETELALAVYNAGPGAVEKIRWKSRRIGRDAELCEADCLGDARADGPEQADLQNRGADRRARSAALPTRSRTALTRSWTKR